MLEGGPLSEDGFQELVRGCVPFCSIERPDAGESLRSRLGVVGLPGLVWLEADGSVLLKVALEDRSVEGFRRSRVRAQEYLRLRAGSAAGEPEASARFLLMQLEERELEHAVAVERRQALESEDAELLGRLDALLVDLGVSAQLRRAGQEGRYELGPRFLAMLQEGPRPTPHVSRGFWFAILEWAERERDVAAFRRGLGGFREALQLTDPDAAWVGPLLKRYEQRLEQLERNS